MNKVNNFFSEIQKVNKNYWYYYIKPSILFNYKIHYFFFKKKKINKYINKFIKQKRPVFKRTMKRYNIKYKSDYFFNQKLIRSKYLIFFNNNKKIN